VLHYIKLACLSYSSSPISYRGSNYQVSDLLKVKASIISDCQKIIREQVYGRAKDMGGELLKFNDERSFVIEPLLGIR